MESEPDWYSGTLYGDSKCQLSEEQKKLQDSIIEAVASKASNSSEPIQQSDTLKPFLLDIGNFGLNYAYHKYYCKETNDANEYKHKKTDHPINVIIIGAGMSGLAAAYELAQSGHNVTILESQHRVGGRVKTVGESHFHKGLWADGELALTYTHIINCIHYYIFLYQLEPCVSLALVNLTGMVQVIL